MTKIEPSEVPERAALQVQDYYDGATPSHEVVAAILSDPAIQRLVVRKCVEGMGEEQLFDLVRELYSAAEGACFWHDTRDARTALIAALCPPDQGEGWARLLAGRS